MLRNNQSLLFSEGSTMAEPEGTTHSPPLKRKRTDDDSDDAAHSTPVVLTQTVPITKVIILDVWTKFELTVIRLSDETFLLAREGMGAFLFPTYACDGRYSRNSTGPGSESFIIPFESIIFDANKANGREYEGPIAFTREWIAIFTAFAMHNTKYQIPESINIQEYREAYIEDKYIVKSGGGF